MVQAPATYLSPRQLADAVGVSESSIKRWADEGRIHQIRTAGGHRRIPVDQALRFVREARLDLRRPDLLGLSGVAPVRAGLGAEHTDRLVPLLRAGTSEEFRSALLGAYVAGEGVAALCDGPVRAALAAVGELWREDDAGIFTEHRATAIAVSALNQLLLLQPVLDGAPLALGGAISGDPSQAPSLMAATVLAAEGFQVVNLGADTPAHTFLDAADQHRPRVVWISVNHVEDPAAAGREVDAALAGLAERGVPAVLGGRGVAALARKTGGSEQVAGSMAELAAFARGVRGAGA